MPNKLFSLHPKGYGKGSRECTICTARQGLVRRYDMNLCRRCFREQAPFIGFKKVTLPFSKFLELKSIVQIRDWCVNKRRFKYFLFPNDS